MPLDLFYKSDLPDKLPEDMERLALQLQKAPSKKHCLKSAYRVLTARYKANRTKTFTRIYELFTLDIGDLWRRRGFLHCTNMEYVLRTLLVKSGHFKDEEIEVKWTLIWYVSPHQYLRVKLDKKRWVNVDVWAASHRLRFGRYASRFNIPF